jgi:hypothetical protein
MTTLLAHVWSRRAADGPRVGRDGAFREKSKIGIKTPEQEIGLIRDRLRRLRELLT